MLGTGNSKINKELPVSEEKQADTQLPAANTGYVCALIKL